MVEAFGLPKHNATIRLPWEEKERKVGLGELPPRRPFGICSAVEHFFYKLQVNQSCPLMVENEDPRRSFWGSRLSAVI